MSWNMIMMAQKWVEMKHFIIKFFLFVSNFPKLLVKYVKYDEKRLPQGQNWPKQVLFRVENSVSVLPDHEDGHQMGTCHENHTLVIENFWNCL